MSDTRNDPEDARTETGVPVRKACFCVGVFFALMLLFNGVSMYASANLLVYGRSHDFWVSALRPVERLSRASGLFRVRQVTQDTVGQRLNGSEGKGEEKR